MITGNIKSITKAILQENNSTFLDVELELWEDGKLIEIRKLGYPLTATAEEIKEDLKKYVANYNAEIEMAVKNKEMDELHAKASETINELNGLEL